MSHRPLRIGVTSCLLPPDSERALYKTKTLLYWEETTARWLMSNGVIPMLLPRPFGPFGSQEIIEWVDGLLIHGGTDVAPEQYGETPLDETLRGDPERDVYEFALLQETLKANKPVLGICRGCQVLNVYFGGTLYQRISEQRPNTRVHRCGDLYDQHMHQLDIVEGSLLSEIYPGEKTATVNSVHYQGVKELAPGLSVEAHSEDGVIESIRLPGEQFVMGTQWHPEFHFTTGQPTLDPAPLLEHFLDAARAT